MPVDTLEKLYVEELRDLYNAEAQILKALPKMIKAASHKELKRGFTLHERQTRQQVKRLDRIFKSLGANPRGKKCLGMEGLLKEGAELIKEKPEADVLDAGLISKAQHVEHYEIAGYGSVRTWAEQLGHADHAELLQETLDEEKETNQKLSQLALSAVNIDALEASEEEASSRGARRRSSGRHPGGRASGRKSGRAESNVPLHVGRERAGAEGDEAESDREEGMPELAM
jgi:ferritin-like metal-binding protein YciE